VRNPQLTLITDQAIYPFLRTTHHHRAPATTEMVRHPVVIFFPGEYSRMLTVVPTCDCIGLRPTPRSRTTSLPANQYSPTFDTPISMTAPPQSASSSPSRLNVDRWGDQGRDERTSGGAR